MLIENFGILFMILTAIAKYKVSESKYHGSVWEWGDRFAFQNCQFYKTGYKLCCPFLKSNLKALSEQLC